jgi:hypothetical protein
LINRIRTQVELLLSQARYTPHNLTSQFDWEKQIRKYEADIRSHLSYEQQLVVQNEELKHQYASLLKEKEKREAKLRVMEETLTRKSKEYSE